MANFMDELATGSRHILSLQFSQPAFGALENLSSGRTWRDLCKKETPTVGSDGMLQGVWRRFCALLTSRFVSKLSTNLAGKRSWRRLLVKRWQIKYIEITYMCAVGFSLERERGSYVDAQVRNPADNLQAGGRRVLCFGEFSSLALARQAKPEDLQMARRVKCWTTCSSSGLSVRCSGASQDAEICSG